MSLDQITKIGGGYWEKRALKLELLTQEKASDTVKAVCRNYNQVQRNIVDQIEKIFSRYVNHNEALNEEKALRLLSEKQTEECRQKLLELYNSTDDPRLRAEIRARLEAPAYANRISGLQALRDRIYTDCRMLGLVEVELVRDRLMDVLEQSYYRQTFDIQQGVGLYYDFSRLDNRQMQAIIAQKWEGGNYSSRIWNNNRQFAEAVEHTVASGILSGQSFRDMSDNLRHIVGEDDSEGAKYKSMRLIRTECNHIATQGQMLGYEAGGIEWYLFLATLDLVTSEICRSLDMKRFPVSEAKAGVNRPPMHPHCRSTTMPEVDMEVLAKIKRAARDPVTHKSITVPGDMSYAEWYRQYVQGNRDAEDNEKKVRNRQSDKKLFEQYRAVLGDHAPKSLVSFQRMKYNEPEKWEFAKLDYARRNKLKNHPEIALPNAENAVAPEPKFTKYLFNPENQKGYPKGNAFTSRLGYGPDNWSSLQEEIVRGAKEYPATFKGNNGFGDLYEQKMVLYGKNRIPANVIVGWIQRPDRSVSMTSAYIKEVKKNED